MSSEEGALAARVERCEALVKSLELAPSRLEEEVVSLRKRLFDVRVRAMVVRLQASPEALRGLVWGLRLADLLRERGLGNDPRRVAAAGGWTLAFEVLLKCRDGGAEERVPGQLAATFSPKAPHAEYALFCDGYEWTRVADTLQPPSEGGHPDDAWDDIEDDFAHLLVEMMCYLEDGRYGCEDITAATCEPAA